MPSEARSAVERVYEMLRIIDPPADVLRGVVGMRNAIIQDYLNLDWELVGDVFSTHRYALIECDIAVATAALLQHTGD